MTKKWMIGVLIVSVLALTGCGEDPNAASKSLFAKLIDTEYLPNKCPLADDRALDKDRQISFLMDRLHFSQFPLTLRLRDKKVGTSNREDQLRPYNVMVKAGLLTVSVSKGKDSLGRPQTIYRYDMTPEGKKRYKVLFNTSMGALAGFCVGEYKVDEVLRYSKPNRAFGYTVSNVVFTMKAVNVPDWVNSAEFKAAFPGLQSELEPQQKKTMMVLFDDGWHHMSLMD